MRSTERHHLKQDQFATTATETYSWALEHRMPLIYGGLVVAVVLAIVLGAWFYLQQQEQKASLDLGIAMRTYDAPVLPAGTPAQPGEETYHSTAERSKAATPKLLDVANKYSHTPSGAMARYFAGISELDAGDNGAAESTLKEVADSRRNDLAALAKQALAGLYHETNRDPQAIQMYKELIDKPTNTVDRTTAQLQLAELYAPTNPTEARKLYEQIQKDNPTSPAANLANTRLQDLK